MINREEAFILIKKYLKDEDNIAFIVANIEGTGCFEDTFLDRIRGRIKCKLTTPSDYPVIQCESKKY